MVHTLLETALDIGIKENEYWSLSIGEIVRAMKSYERVKKMELKERATFDYNLALLIASNVGASFGGGKPPTFNEAYPFLEEKEKVEDRTDVSVARFLEYAHAHNRKFKGGDKQNEQ